MRANNLTRYRRLLRAATLGMAAFAVVSMSGCATWRESPQGAAPRKLDKPEIVELSVRAGEGANVQGVGGLLSRGFADAGYEVRAVPPNAPASGPDVARVDVSASIKPSGLGIASGVISGCTLFILPGLASDNVVVDGEIRRGDAQVPYRFEGGGRIFFWLPCVLAAPFCPAPPTQIDLTVRDIGVDLVRKVQALPTVAPAPTAQ